MNDDEVTPLTEEEMRFWGYAGSPWTAADFCHDIDVMFECVQYVKTEVDKGGDLKHWLHMLQITNSQYEEGLVKYKDELD